ncbi:hypothetical protein [Bradyrhizobium barranii]|uniref:hypothetical protein n=1 Tax=Bradyrhizobium barranii TaxID=2992140 RepID=UPI00158AA487|nr:hypothetical protein [Bradyrhizobium barranii]
MTELPDDIAQRIGEVLKAFGYDPQGDRCIEPAADVPDGSQAHSTNFFRKLNEDALSNLHAWVAHRKLFGEQGVDGANFAAFEAAQGDVEEFQGARHLQTDQVGLNALDDGGSTHHTISWAVRRRPTAA